VDTAALLELAQVARLADGDEDLTHVLHRLVGHAVSLVPGCTAAALTASVPGGGSTAAQSDDRVTACHDVQFREGGDGPARECLRYNEPRRVDDVDRESRWPAFRAAARSSGFASCLALPLRTDRLPSAALNLYADRADVFAATTLDTALLFAAQGGVALDNAARYHESRELVEHLHRALATRGIVERARGLLMSQHDLTSEQALAMLRTESQRTHRKLTEVATAVLDQHDPGNGPATPSWNPVRHRPATTQPLAEGPPRT
jgi:GAF domain-containing protein